LQRLLGTGDIVEFTLGIIMEDQEPEGCATGLASESQHRDISVGVPGSP
jgi:hypothetical protein